MTSTDWKELVGADEEQRFAELVALVLRLQKQNVEVAGRPMRSFHARGYGTMRGEFRVLDGIPAEARHGVFAQPRTYPAWIRFSNQAGSFRPDSRLDILGIGVKLLGVEGDKVLEDEKRAATQDLLGFNVPSVPVARVEHVPVVATAVNSLLLAPFRIVRSMGLIPAVRVGLWAVRHWFRRVDSILTESYWSNSAMQLGPHAVKFAFTPTASGPRAGRGLVEDLAGRVAAGQIRFDFSVQFFRSESETPIEPGPVPWPKDVAPSIKIAELVLPQQDLDSQRALEDAREGDSYAYTQWHSLPEHRPLGEFNRARKSIYLASSWGWGRAPEPGAPR